MRRNQWFTVRKSSRLVKMVNDLMDARGFVSYSEMFRTLVREAWERYCSE